MRAADRFAAIPVRLQDFVDRGEIAGAVALVADKDRILHLGAVGCRDLASGEPMQANDLFAIASMTKPFTAVAVALLVEEGRITFDDPVEKHLPEFRDLWTIVEETTEPTRRVLEPSPRPITVRDLLAHTSGLEPVKPLDPHWTLGEVARLLARAPLRFAPGSRWEYSDSGYFVLGRIVEVVTDEPFPAYVQRRILAPLGMQDTTFCLSPEQRTRLALCYRYDPAGGQLVPTLPPASFGDPTDATRGPNPAGGLFSTAADLAPLYQMLLKGGEHGGRRFLRAETVAELLRPQTGTLPVRPGFAWGLGFALIQDPSQVDSNRAYTPGSFGHGGATGTVVWADPGRGTIHVLLLQIMGTPSIAITTMRIAFEQAADSALRSPP
jgi:CubicO group peptidase (beta-lactamase class C family)